ncbi:hypothetical protein K438DRAFT_715858 [Mycena galopus ATCC 62051]|nr:hypothetical protein K438DRAFT_715858 [Mycena galopus ATCC 62051]
MDEDKRRDSARRNRIHGPASMHPRAKCENANKKRWRSAPVCSGRAPPPPGRLSRYTLHESGAPRMKTLCMIDPGASRPHWRSRHTPPQTHAGLRSSAGSGSTSCTRIVAPSTVRIATSHHGVARLDVRSARPHISSLRSTQSTSTAPPRAGPRSPLMIDPYASTVLEMPHFASVCSVPPSDVTPCCPCAIG